jgi:hypothetical protein
MLLTTFNLHRALDNSVLAPKYWAVETVQRHSLSQETLDLETSGARGRWR